jgi:hypothetical protein
MDKYPIERSKVEILKSSIEQTGFWDNVVARPHPKLKGKYQLAYGHHRLVAIQELSITEIDIPIRNLDDATMLQMMANENFQQWKMSIAVLNETVLVAKEFLDGELAKYELWGAVLKDPNKFIRVLFGTEHAFMQTKRSPGGVGQTIIHKFLGKGWEQWKIQDALNTLLDEEINRTAVEAFGTVSEGKEFKKIMKEKKIPKEEQLIIAEKVSAERKVGKPTKKTGATTEQRRREFHGDIRKVASKYFEGEEDNADLIDLQAKIKTLQERITSAKRAAMDLNSVFVKYQVEEIGDSIQKLFTVGDILELMKELKIILGIFNIQYPKGDVLT